MVPVAVVQKMREDFRKRLEALEVQGADPQDSEEPAPPSRRTPRVVQPVVDDEEEETDARPARQRLEDRLRILERREALRERARVQEEADQFQAFNEGKVRELSDLVVAQQLPGRNAEYVQRLKDYAFQAVVVKDVERHGELGGNKADRFWQLITDESARIGLMRSVIQEVRAFDKLARTDQATARAEAAAAATPSPAVGPTASAAPGEPEDINSPAYPGYVAKLLASLGIGR